MNDDVVGSYSYCASVTQTLAAGTYHLRVSGSISGLLRLSEQQSGLYRIVARQDG